MDRTASYRQVGRYAKQDRARLASAQAIEAAYQLVLTTREAYNNAPAGNDRAEFAAYDAAVDALMAIAPAHHHFS
jgi:hypothetical protein